MRMMIQALLALLSLATLCTAAVIQADPSDYKSKLGQLQPGDILELAAGDYTQGLSLSVRGTAGAWITVRSADASDPAVILGRDNNNTAELWNCSYLALEDLRFDGLDIDGVFAVSAKGGSANLTHNIRVEGCTIVNHGAHQYTVGISTKIPTWGWIVRGNRILGAGTGMYLGNSNGQEPFVAGIIENNLIYDAEGYCMQIKHQFSRPSIAGMPTSPQVTIIRHNVFIKTDRPSGVGDRPSLLLGAVPQSGTGSEDLYEVYGNFFYDNPREFHMQAEGRVSIHDNVFVDSPGGAINLGNHNLTLRLAHVYNNTIHGVNRGIWLRHTPDQDAICVGNAVFADSPFYGGGVWNRKEDNVTDSIANAANHVNNPSTTLGQMDFYPSPGKLQGTALDLSGFTSQIDYDRDFNGDAKGGRPFRGAYAGEGVNPGWQLDNAVKGTQGGSLPPADTTPPTGSIDATGNATIDDPRVDLDVSAADDSGTVLTMSFSNNGSTWSPPEPYGGTRTDWDLTAYGGSATAGPKTVHARFADSAGNWSTAAITTSVELAAGDPGPGTSGGSVGVLELFFLLFLVLCGPRARLLS